MESGKLNAQNDARIAGGGFRPNYCNASARVVVLFRRNNVQLSGILRDSTACFLPAPQDSECSGSVRLHSIQRIP